MLVAIAFDALMCRQSVCRELLAKEEQSRLCATCSSFLEISREVVCLVSLLLLPLIM